MMTALAPSFLASFRCLLGGLMVSWLSINAGFIEEVVVVVVVVVSVVSGGLHNEKSPQVVAG